MKSLSVGELVDWIPPKVSTLIGEPSSAVLVPRGRMIVYGRWGSYKSMIAGLDLGMRGAYGKPWLGLHTAGFSTFYLQIELTQSMMQRRAQKYLLGNGMRVTPRFRIASEPWYKLDRDPNNTLGVELYNHKPDVLVIDPIFKVMSGDISSSTDANRITDIADALADRYQCAVILVGHIRKPGQNEQGEYQDEELEHELIGSSIFMDWADTAVSMRLESKVQDFAAIQVRFEKTRYSENLITPRRVVVRSATLEIEAFAQSAMAAD